MKGIVKLLTLTTVAGLFFLTSCKDDEVPKSNLVFDEIAMEVKESDGTPASFHPLLFDNATGREVAVQLTLDRPLAETSVIAFSVEGTAKTNSTTNPVGDFEIKENAKNITIDKGETSASILIQLYEDEGFEIDNNDNLFETVIIKLTSVVSGTAIIGTDDTFTLKITEDDAVVFLDWDDGDNVAPPDRGDVDMDTYLFLDGQTVAGSAESGSAAVEAFNIPAAYPNGTYGVSYTYYSGTSDALKFFSIMFNFGGTMNGGTYNAFNGPALEFTQDYKLVNINKYDEPGAPEPIVVQTMTKNGFNYSNITQITKPATGSRMDISGDFAGLRSQTLHPIEAGKAERLFSLLKGR
jgi:hypothetical protein